jgi:S-(hydroxymethyl)glutathione dehydrogenase/alcohol dehydrogenase
LKTAGVCHSDLHGIKGDLAMPVPVICGREGAGVIESVGEGVASVRPGDRVVPICRAWPGKLTTHY